MQIIHAIAYLGKSQGGPVESLRLLASSQTDLGHRVRVVHTGCAGDGELVDLPSIVEVLQVNSFASLRWAPGFGGAACRDHFLPDVIHSHGLWLDCSRQADGLSRRLRVPHILSPCGMLQKKALRISMRKKKWAWNIFQKRILERCSVLHAKSVEEAQGITSLLPRARIQILPNPIDTSYPCPLNAASITTDFINRLGIPADKKILLYLGRLHPVKGLDRLIQAWIRVSVQFADWALILVGPNENGYRKTLESSIPAKQKPTVVFAGPVYGPDRWTVYRGADLFVLPSDFENFGQSIAEALSAGIPVITTTGTPWKELTEKHCGWWVEPSVEHIASALEEAMSLSDQRRREMGRAGQMLSKRFHPRTIAEQMCQLYRCLIDSSFKAPTQL